MLRKLIFLTILINLVKFNSCESDDLYQKFINEQQKELESIEENLEKKSQKNAADRNKRNYGLNEIDGDDDDDEGGDGEDEHFRRLFNHMRSYRDKNGLLGGVGGSLEASTTVTQKAQSTTTATPQVDTTSSKSTINTSELENRVIETLDVMRDELESMRMSKTCNETPDGSNCYVNGTWNAAEIGLHIELSSASDDNKLVVILAEKIPKKSSPYRIDASWKCSGFVTHINGGPFYFHCTQQHPSNEMAIFHGICKRCSGFDTIFGEWSFQHVPRDCRQLWTFSETKRDVFYKNVLHQKKSQQTSDEGSDKANVNQTASSQIALKSTSGISNWKTKRNDQIAKMYGKRKWNSRDFY